MIKYRLPIHSIEKNIEECINILKEESKKEIKEIKKESELEKQ